MCSKEELMKELINEILNCKKCPLWRTRTNAVPGEGSLNTDIMFIGEAPGRNEDLQGRPFVGAAGKLLTELISKIGLQRSEVYITNVVKCRPPGNRDPTPEEIKACSPYLDKQIQIIKPKIIITLGRHSTKYILSKANIKVNSITKVHGKVFRLNIYNMHIKVIPTYHPAAALYNPRIRSILENDFVNIIKREINYESEGIGLDRFLGGFNVSKRGSR